MSNWLWFSLEGGNKEHDTELLGFISNALVQA